MQRIGFGRVVRMASLVTVGSAVLAAPTPGWAQDAPPPGTDWVTYGWSFSLGDSQHHLLQGKSVGYRACEFKEALSLPPGQQAVEAREVALNLDSCQSVVETGIPPQDVIQQDAAGFRGLRTSAARRVDGAGAVDTAAAAGRVRSAGYLKSTYEDPVEIDVNSVRNNTDWFWNGERVSGPVRSARAYGWYTPSGWELEGNNWRHRFTSYQSTSSSYAHFKNDVFCRALIGPIFGRTTHTYYNRNTVHGRKNGDLVGIWKVRKTGGCNDLLHFEKRLVRTL
jgi:hypothetical protein